MATLPPVFNAQFFTDAGLPAAGHWLYTYESGTTTPKTTHTNQAGDADNANPIVLDAAGRCLLWLGAGEYTFVLKTALGVTIWTRDDVGGVAEATTGDFLPLAGGTMTGPIVLPGNASSALQAVPKQQLDSTIATLSASLTAAITSGIASATPVGTIALWLTGAAPTGWLHLNGQAVSRTTYDDLFTLWGTTFGSGDGSTTFNVPDVRGEFPRFWDASRGVDPGRAIGSAQAGAFEEHHHDIFASDVTSENSDGWSTDARAIPGEETGPFAFRELSEAGDQLISDEGGTETRPRNYSFMGIVKAL
jgi:microcystin-dependent protein